MPIFYILYTNFTDHSIMMKMTSFLNGQTPKHSKDGTLAKIKRGESIDGGMYVS